MIVVDWVLAAGLSWMVSLGRWYVIISDRSIFGCGMNQNVPLFIFSSWMGD
jgi:hypothetical protein